MMSSGVFEKKLDSSRLRIKSLIFAFILGSLVILIRLFTWQIVRGDQLTRVARSQHQASATILAQRGGILSSDGYPLVFSKEAWLVWASLPDIEDPSAIASLLAPIFVDEEKEGLAGESNSQDRKEILEIEEARIKKLLQKKDVIWVPLKHKISDESRSKIAKLDFKGVGFDREEVRGYPEGSMSAHLLGFVGSDAAGQDQGYFGLEGYYDLTLSGTRGQSSWEKDAQGNPILVGASQRITALDGLSLKTYIDRALQFTLERHLEEGIARYGAASGVAIIMRPQDGAILAMASRPSYEPAEFSKFGKEVFVNPAVGESFEPGSVFKPIIMAAALDSGEVQPDTRCTECSGPRRIAEYTISTWNDKYFPDSTAAEIIEHSDNVGMVWVGEKLGKEKLYDYLQKFGIGALSGIDLQDETTPSLRQKDSWGLVDVATTAFGQGIAVTPIQLIRAVAAIANKGWIVTPRVVAEVWGQGFSEGVKPSVGKKVISEDAARQITEMMVNAVEKGEAQWTKLSGFRVAGKTGTAQIPIKGHYDSEKTIASFVGFAPADNPRFVMLVTLREPKSSPWASETAAPLWFAVARDIFPYLGIHPSR